MTVHSDHDFHMVACNGCGQELDTHEDFQSAVDEAKSEGWRIERNSGVWTHHCPDCEGGTSETALQRAKRMFGKS